MDALRRVQPIDDVLAARSRLGGDGLAAAFLIDQFSQCRLIMVLELLGIEGGRLLVHDMLGEIEHGIEDPKCPNHAMSAVRYGLTMFAGNESMYDPERKARESVRCLSRGGV